MKNFKYWTMALLIAVGVIGCQGIPNSFQGEYEDRTHGVYLELTWNDATIRLPGGRSVNGKLAEFKFDELRSGKSQIYARENSANKDMTEIYWLQPDLSTRQVGGGLEWFESDVIYTMINVNENNVRTLTLVHCAKGVVLLDTVTSQAQIGCPAAAERWNFIKTRDGGRQPDPGGGA